MHGKYISRTAIQRLINDIILMIAAIFGTPDSARSDLDAGAVNNRLHVSGAAAQPVVGIVVGGFCGRGDHGLVLDVEGEDYFGELRPGLVEPRGDVVEDGGEAGVVLGFGGCGGVEVV